MIAGNFQCLFPSAKVIIKVALATLKERNEKREDGRKKKNNNRGKGKWKGKGKRKGKMGRGKDVSQSGIL